MDAILIYIMEWAQQYPFFSVMLMIIGFLRAINKPLFALIDAGVAATATDKDDIIWKDAKNSKAMETFLFLIDWFTSVKIKKKQ